MFSKPTITTRNDNITRKDVKSVLGSGSGLAGAVPEPKLVSEPPRRHPGRKADHRQRYRHPVRCPADRWPGRQTQGRRNSRL